MIENHCFAAFTRRYSRGGHGTVRRLVSSGDVDGFGCSVVVVFHVRRMTWLARCPLYHPFFKARLSSCLPQPDHLTCWPVASLSGPRCPPSPPLLGSGCPQLQRTPTASTKRRPFTTAGINGASSRAMFSQPQPDRRSTGIRAPGRQRGHQQSPNGSRNGEGRALRRVPAAHWSYGRTTPSND